MTNYLGLSAERSIPQQISAHSCKTRAATFAREPKVLTWAPLRRKAQECAEVHSEALRKGGLSNSVDWKTPSLDSFGVSIHQPGDLRYMNLSKSGQLRLAWVP